MPGPTLQTVHRSSLRTAAQRRRRRTLAVIGSVVALALVLGGSAWAVFSAPERGATSAVAPSALSGVSAPAGAETSATSPATGGSTSTSLTPSAAETLSDGVSP